LPYISSSSDAAAAAAAAAVGHIATPACAASQRHLANRYAHFRVRQLRVVVLVNKIVMIAP